MDLQLSARSKGFFPAIAVLATLALAACTTAPPDAGAKPTAVAGAEATPLPSPTAAAVPVATTSPASGATIEVTPTGTPTATGDSATAPTPSSPMALELSTYTVRPGDTLAIRAAGFAPGETVLIHFGGKPPVEGDRVQASATGEVLAADLRVPALTEDKYDLSLTGEQSGRRVSRTISAIGFTPWVVLTNYALRPGERTGFSGAGFRPNERVQVFMDGGATPLVVARANDQGEVQVTDIFRAEWQDVGNHHLEFVADQTNARLPVAFEVLPFVPTFELSTYAGPPGTVVTFEGRGFAPGETVHATIEQGNSRVEADAFQADGNGSLARAGELRVPPSAAGDLVIRLEGEHSRVPVSQRFGVLPLSPWAGLSAYSGPSGTLIHFLGKGFAAGESVSITAGDGAATSEVATAITDDRGGFEVGPFAVPGDAAGTLAFSYRGASSGGQAHTEFAVVKSEG